MVGAILLEQNDEWAVQRARYMTLETINQMSDDPPVSLPAVARGSSRLNQKSPATSAVSYTTASEVISPFTL